MKYPWLPVAVIGAATALLLAFVAGIKHGFATHLCGGSRVDYSRPVTPEDFRR